MNMESDSTVTHQTINGRYRIILERAASTKGVDGFKVEVNSDSITVAQEEIQILYDTAKMMTKGEGGMI